MQCNVPAILTCSHYGETPTHRIIYVRILREQVPLPAKPRSIAVQYSTICAAEYSAEGKLWLLCTAHPATVPVRFCPTCLLFIELRGTHTSTHARDTYLAGSQPHSQDEDGGKSSASEMDEQDAGPTCAVGYTHASKVGNKSARQEVSIRRTKRTKSKQR